MYIMTLCVNNFSSDIIFFYKRYVLFYILLRPFIDKNVDIEFRAHVDFIMYAQNQKIEKPNNLQVFGSK